MHRVLLNCLIMGLALFRAASAIAACASPTATAGALEWFSGTSEYKLCDGTNWDVIELSSISLGACSQIASREWDATEKAYKVCDASGNYKKINCLEGGIVGHWKFDETSGTTAVDSSGNMNSGTLTNGPVWTTGQVNGALQFDGSNDYVNIANEANFDFERTSPFSIVLWVNDSRVSGFNYLFTKVHNGTNFPGYRFALDNTNRRIIAQLVGVTGGSGGGDWIAVRTAAGSYQKSVWNHIAITYDGSSLAAGIHLYLNGVDMLLTVDANGLVSSILNNTTARIGHNPADGGGFLTGSADDVRVYNRALSPTEVSSLYNGGSACAGYGPCSTAAQMDYDPTEGMLWCDGTDLRAMKAP